jgi:hypothetical protein
MLFASRFYEVLTIMLLDSGVADHRDIGLGQVPWSMDLLGVFEAIGLPTQREAAGMV